MLANLPAFSRLSFGEWAATLAGQIERGHYLFVLRNNEVEGIAGWAFSDHDQAMSWLEGRSGLPHEACYDGDCVILNVWQTGSDQHNGFCSTICAAFSRIRRCWLPSGSTQTDGCGPSGSSLMVLWLTICRRRDPRNYRQSIQNRALVTAFG